MTILAKIRDCERCGGLGGMIIRDERFAGDRGCVYCGYRRYDGKIRLGDRADSEMDDPALGDLIRGWASSAGLDWGDATVTVGADGDGGIVDVDVDPDFASRWRAAFDALTAVEA